MLAGGEPFIVFVISIHDVFVMLCAVGAGFYCWSSFSNLPSLEPSEAWQARGRVSRDLVVRRGVPGRSEKSE